MIYISWGLIWPYIITWVKYQYPTINHAVIMKPGKNKFRFQKEYALGEIDFYYIFEQIGLVPVDKL